ncbi:MAG: ornithine cyclodeaminase family protein [Clostridiales bacterium]|jgi:ornithine cyclodeaminase|nr:ornithine cyclodeaminase family protein [Clostridiales bacterium]
MILLSKDDIHKVFSMRDAIEANKRCYRRFSENKFDVPQRAVIQGEKGTFLFMPAYSAEMNAASCKIVNIFPENKTKGLAGTVGQVLLIDGETGYVTAVMDGTYVTALRTGAASGAAFDLFGREDAQIGALIGTGSQAACQLEAMLTARPLKEVRIAARNYEKTKAFVQEMKQEMAHFGADLVACEDTNAAVDGADLVTLVTVSDMPVCSAEFFKPGCVVSAVGAYQYHMQELDPAVFVRCGKLYFDSVEAVLSESGDILKPLEDGTLTKEQFTGDIGDYILGKIPGRESDDEIIVYENVGFGALDLAVAAEIYEKAVTAGAGTKWGE